MGDGTERMGIQGGIGPPNNSGVAPPPQGNNALFVHFKTRKDYFKKKATGLQASNMRVAGSVKLHWSMCTRLRGHW